MLCFKQNKVGVEQHSDGVKREGLGADFIKVVQAFSGHRYHQGTEDRPSVP